jgi:hypothetical protein
MTVTYSSCLLERGTLLLKILRSTSLLAHHSLGVSASRDNHRCVGASSRYTAIVHDVLRIILTKRQINVNNCNFINDMISQLKIKDR